uniref:Uncharacterized protein n=1 Tax=Glossina palpalis gambiensis TaxID=67801 RepID=A0A1B0BM02_9MUSC
MFLCIKLTASSSSASTSNVCASFTSTARAATVNAILSMLNPKIKTPTDFVATLDSSSDAVVSTPILPIPTQIQEAKKTNQSKSSDQTQ